MSRALPIALLVGGGLAAWWASRAAAAEAGDKEDPILRALTGGGGGEGEKKAPVQIGRIGADTVFPDKAAELDVLRQMSGAVLSQGGRLEVQSPDYVLVVDTPPTVNPVQIPIPVYTSAVLSQDGRYVPLNAVYLGVTVPGTRASYKSNPSPMDRFQTGYIDVFSTDNPGDQDYYVFREANAPQPPFGYTFSGQIMVPEAFVFDSPELPNRMVFNGGTSIPERPIYYDATKDPNGIWWSRIVNRGVRILDISQRPTS